MTSFLYLLVVLGSLQGVVTAMLLQARKTTPYANRLLAWVVLVTALPGIHLYAHYADFFNGTLPARLAHALVPWISVMVLGPLVFFQTKASCDNSFRLGKRHLVHFIPALIDLLPKFAELLFLAGGLSSWTTDLLTLRLDIYNQYADLPRWISLTWYLYQSGTILKKLPSHRVAMLQRLRRFLFAMKVFAGIWLLYLIPYLLPATHDILNRTVGWFPVYVPLAVMVYWMGLAAISGQQVQGATKKTSETYTQDQLAHAATQLQWLMEKDSPYLDAMLDVATLAGMTGLPQKLVSAAVNQVLQKNFNQFVNEYRVAAFQRGLEGAAYRNMTMAGLAASCGFSSTATFQRSFKQVTGLTPTEFIRSRTQPAG